VGKHAKKHHLRRAPKESTRGRQDNCGNLSANGKVRSSFGIPGQPLGTKKATLRDVGENGASGPCVKKV